MECKFAFLCDFAEESGGKLHAIGIGWDTIYARIPPGGVSIHSMMTFVASIRGTIAESGTKEVMLRLIDADGEDVLPPQQQNIPFAVKAPQLSGNMNFVVQLGGVPFKKYGAYALHLLVQGNEMGPVVFNVSPLPTTA